MHAQQAIHPDVVKKMREDVSDSLALSSGGVEILWVGQVDDEGIIVEVSTAARGTADMVPALFPHMTRGDAVIHNHPGGNLKPSGADLRVASRLGNQGIGFLIVDDDVLEINIIAAPIPRRIIVPLDIEELAGVVEANGELSSHLDSFEPRQEQIDLLRMVGQAFNTGRPLIAEAGTGVGKSMAYLLPALKWASENDERVVVSTATIALQQQLMEKDIPLACKALGITVKVALVKGRGNYLCLKRLQEAAGHDELFSSGEEMERIRNWSESSSTGSKSDLPFNPGEEEWGRVRCESDNCPGSFCSHFESCFLMRARRRAAESSLLVANHHLLFADLAARQDGPGPDEAVVLPPYRRIILDEAHHVEGSATDLFTSSISLPVLTRLFTRLIIRKGRVNTGLLQRLAQKCSHLSEQFIGEIPPVIDVARSLAENLDATGRELLGGENRVRLSGEVREIERTRLVEPMEALKTALSNLTLRFSDTVKLLDDENPDPELEGLAVEARQTLAGLQNALLVADSFLHRDEYPQQVFWLESLRRSDGTERLSFHRTPLSVADLMRESVWEPYETVIGMSATLAVGGDFGHWKSRVGALDITREPLEAVYSSPFDYRSRVMLGVPIDAPSPESQSEWENYLVDAVARVLDLSGGHALVLFTSYETLRFVLQGVRTALSSGAPILLAQGDDDRGRLLKKFREHPSSVLFATDSFWEGVDVPGDSLKVVLITRLPFRPPTNPVDQARGEALAAAGGNPFMQLSLPDAVTRFRQGFGRLMRRSDDHGVVLVLDSRIYSKRYGPLFLDSLPPASRSIKNLDGVLRDVENFLFP